MVFSGFVLQREIARIIFGEEMSLERAECQEWCLCNIIKLPDMINPVSDLLVLVITKDGKLDRLSSH